jgi:hypothetical protein
MKLSPKLSLVSILILANWSNSLFSTISTERHTYVGDIIWKTSWVCLLGLCGERLAMSHLHICFQTTEWLNHLWRCVVQVLMADSCFNDVHKKSFVPVVTQARFLLCSHEELHVLEKNQPILFQQFACSNPNSAYISLNIRHSESTFSQKWQDVQFWFAATCNSTLSDQSRRHLGDVINQNNIY